MTFKPMLAGKYDPALIKFPVLVSPKLDGVRCLAMDGKPMSRSMKVIRNRFMQDWFADNTALLEGLDGELIVGDPTAPDVYRRTNSGVMSEDGEPDFKFYVFDYWNRQGDYSTGYDILVEKVGVKSGLGQDSRLKLLFNTKVHTQSDLDILETICVSDGYEGVMTRDPNSPYKQGRSSTKEGYLLKVKRYSDAEAVVIGFEEEMHNGNEAQTNELGRTKRSSHQENKTGKGTLGAFICEGLTAFPGVTFNVGTGFDANERSYLWRDQNNLIGKVIKFKYFEIGVKDAPRHPVYLGMRDNMDIT